ncbi:MAG: hypothetical protein HYW50_01020 [Candidatus Diapherotrites archaeon]|nr:hypothetical protein [Candidatus Diapherotrites archaeon]
MFSQKGQEAAPFELLIAVVVMGFVLLAGINVMGILQLEECKGTLDSQMEKIKTAIEGIVAGEGQRDFSYSLPHCFKRSTEEDDALSKTVFEIQNVTSRQVCTAYCSGARFECMLLWFRTEDYHNAKCLRISTATNFPEESGTCNDFSIEEFEPVDLTEGILEGQYFLVRKFDLSSANANICAYNRVI